MRPIDADVLYIPPEEMNAKMAVAYAPTIDAVPVVRCSDCAYWEKSFECWYEGSKHYHCYLLDICTDENFYCADGERIKDEK